MTHPRKELRDAIKALLVAAGTDAGSRVYDNRSEALPHEDGGSAALPAIVVRMLEEDADLTNEVPKCYRRRQVVAVELFVDDAGGDASDAADTLSEQVETAMFESGDQLTAPLTARFWPSRYLGCRPLYRDEAERDLVLIQMRWEYPFQTDAAEVQTPAITDFEEVKSEWDVSELDPATNDGGEDLVVLPTD